ncbi:MAG: hypothetical protein DHS20C04_20170 [Hyphococcus sp.]|nr:MAG: hypothetical protein DHS20C04_20170 [Marinicaulis sp.]
MDRRILVFTVHKAASLGVAEVMRRVAKKEGWPLHSANMKKASLVEPKAPGDVEFFSQLEGKTGLVGPIRMPVALAGKAASDKLILNLRDPRDVLVSMFFSWGYSHPGVDKDLRARLRSEGLDEFVLRESAALKEKYELYVRNYLSLPDTILLKYEDFVLDRPAWLSAFLRLCDIDPEQRHYIRLGKNNPAAKVREEDKFSHIRKAAPGDHEEKLKAGTIAELNSAWANILPALGY